MNLARLGPRLALVGLLLFSGLGACKRREAAAPVRRTEQVAPEVSPADDFRYSVESFADVQLLRYRVPGFEALSLAQKQLLYYLYEAALSGRDITYDQRYEHNLLVRRTLEAILMSYGGNKEATPYKALVTYAKRVWFSNGIHHHYSTKKFLPEGLTPEQFASLVRGSDPARLPLAPRETLEQLITKLTPILFDPKVAPKSVNKDEGQDPVRDSANHYYEGLTREEVANYTKQLQKPGDAAPIQFGLNSQLIKLPNGEIEERVWRADGMYGAALTECVRWLEQALTVAENPAQREAIKRLITFYRTGDLHDWDRYSLAWLADTESRIDLIHGFIETFGDAMGLRGTYEGLLEIEDAEATAQIRILSENAQWFEDHSPIPDPYKKPNVTGISARVIQAVVGVGDSGPVMPSGVNLPNSSWIRQKHGSKSVSLGNVIAAQEAASRDSGELEEFASGPRELTRAKRYDAQGYALFVYLHEVVGHASGKLASGVGEIADTLRQYAAPLEEARADLVALYYLLDPKLVALKLMPSLEVGRAAYDRYVRKSMLVQLARVPEGENLEEPHMRSRQLVTRWAYEQGKQNNVIELLERERAGKSYAVIRDYVRLRKLFGQLLKELQRIKSEGDFESARDLVETYGVHPDPKLHEQVLARYAHLNLPPYTGFIQPELVPVKKGDEIVDVRIEYPTDFVAQQLRYAAKYSFLPTAN